jgi:type 1 glutamine amidotransferase
MTAKGRVMPRAPMSDPRALIVHGGWEGHEPSQFADHYATVLRDEGFAVDVSDSLDALLDRDALGRLRLIVPIWTMGTLEPEQLRGLREAVAGGVGLAGFHGGMGDAFRAATEFQWMVGGQFVAHPDDIKDYEVTIVDHESPIMRGLDDFRVRSEQYYMHVDPSNEVLATTTFHPDSAPWLDGVVMPVVWIRQWGAGRVFYSSLGHSTSELAVPEVGEIQRRGMLWGARWEDA